MRPALGYVAQICCWGRRSPQRPKRGENSGSKPASHGLRTVNTNTAVVLVLNSAEREREREVSLDAKRREMTTKISLRD